MTNEQHTRNDNFLIAQFERSAESIANDLDRLAEAVRRAPDRAASAARNGRVARPWLSQAEEIVQSIMNTLPNLNLGLLIERAHDCETMMSEETFQ